MATNGRVAEFNNRLRAAQRSGSAARAEFLAAYRSYLRFLARDGIGAELRGKVDASDLAQDVLLAAQVDLPGFRGATERDLLAWLRRILAHRIVDYARKYVGVRRRAREQSIEDLLDESSTAFEVMAASGLSPSRLAQRHEAAAALAEALRRLSDDHREVIRLRTTEGRSWDDVAERMGRSAGAVRMLWVRALAELRPLLEGTR